MRRSTGTRTRGHGLAVLWLLAAVAMAGAAIADELPGSVPSARGATAFTLESISPLTRSTPTPFGSNFYGFVLTNTGAAPDTFRLAAENVSPAWAVTVQNSVVTVPLTDPFDYAMDAGDSDTLLVDFVPFADGVGSFDFVVSTLPGGEQTESFHLTLYVGSAAVGVEALPATAAAVRLLPAEPNPFRHGTEIRYELMRAGAVDLRIFDAGGRLVRVLETGPRAAGRHAVRWDGRGADGRPVVAGTYFSRLAAAGTASTRRIVLLR